MRGVFRLLQRSVNDPEKCVRKGKLCLKTGVHGLPAGIWQNGFVRIAYTYNFLLAIEKNCIYSFDVTDVVWKPIRSKFRDFA